MKKSLLLVIGTLFFLSLLSSCYKEPGDIAVASVKLSETMLNLHIGESATLTATVAPENATNKSLTWISSNTSVASVSNGVVVALNEGSSIIMATAENVTAMCAVTVLDNPVTGITLDQTSASLKVNESITLTATVSPTNATDKTVIWSTSDESVATVSNGVVIAARIGTATITATAGDRKATCDISVVATPVEKITLDQTSVTLKAKESVTLTATVSPDDATDKTVTWSTSDESVATVSNGVVIAVKTGTATVTAQAGDKKATCSITVEATPVTSVTLDRTSASLNVNESITLTATVKPDDATDKTVTWTSSNESIASVTEGVVTAHKGGTATITAQAGDKTATCEITVKSIPVTSVTLDKTSASLKVKETVTLTATVKPDDATDKTVTWTSSNENVATVTDGVVTAINIGTATVSAKAGDITAVCDVTVEPTPVTEITLNKNSATLTEGDEITLTATVKPDDATNKNFTWSSSDPSVASVADGKVKALKAGTTTISAVTEDGNKTATCDITVVEPPKAESLTLSDNSFYGFIYRDHTKLYSVSVSASPSNAVTEYEWSSSDTRVAKVAGYGNSANIYTEDYGESTISVTEKRSGLSASLTIHTVVENFTWKESTSDTMYGFPMITIYVGEGHKLRCSYSPSSATKVFSDLKQFVFYEPYVVDKPSCISISEDGVVTGLKTGIVGIKPNGLVIPASGTNRLYIKVIAK